MVNSSVQRNRRYAATYRKRKPVFAPHYNGKAEGLLFLSFPHRSMLEFWIAIGFLHITRFFTLTGSLPTQEAHLSGTSLTQLLAPSNRSTASLPWG